MQLNSIRFGLNTFFVSILWVLSGLTLAAEKLPSVLLLNSYHAQYQWTAEITRGVQDTIETVLPAESLHVEFMDTRRYIDDQEYYQKLLDLLAHKYQLIPPDLIITSDDNAYYFLMEHGDSLFPNKPIIFCGVNVFNPETLVGKENVTGIQEGMAIEGNLQLIQALQPEVKRVIMLGDSTGLGSRMVEKAKSIQARWRDGEVNKMSLEIWDDFTFDELLKNASQADSETAFLVLAIHKDSKGKYFSYLRDLPLLAQASAVPVYGMWGTLMLGSGVLGGLMNNPYLHGQNVAGMALDVLSGTPISDLPVLPSAEFRPYFDHVQLTKFDISTERLPKNSTLIGKPESLYGEHSGLINSVLFLIFFLIVVISQLIVNVRQKAFAQVKLRQFNAELEYKVSQRTKDLDERNQQLEAASLKMEELAYTDTLTGMANRRAGVKEVKAYIQRASTKYSPIVIAILDIDHFKQVNDTYGHQVGDEVLCDVATFLRNCLRPSDRVYRWGGEEFLIMLPGADASLAMDVCQRLREGVSGINFLNAGQVTVSIGLTEFKTDDSYDSIIQRADESLYLAKERGRDRVIIDSQEVA